MLFTMKPRSIEREKPAEIFRFGIKRLLNIIIPPRCLSCGSMTEESGMLCQNCWKNISFISKPFCECCGFPFEYDIGEALCAGCIKESKPFDNARSAFRYNEDSRKLITSYKYSDKTYGTESFARMMLRVAGDLVSEADIISSVPLHRLRLLSRKYNQSALLANKIAKISNRTAMHDILFRKKNSKPQASLPRNERMKNVKGVFAINDKYKEFIKGKKIMLVDDVMTTGATVNECARLLKKSGAEKVFVLTLARTVGNE